MLTRATLNDLVGRVVARGPPFAVVGLDPAQIENDYFSLR